MKKFYATAFAFNCFFSVFAQTHFTVLPGTDLYLSPGSTFSAGGLALSPSSGFTINGLSLSGATTVSHTLATTYISRVYKFSSNTAAFTGNINFSYSDAELNGLNESNLGVTVYNGSAWKKINTNSRDITNNFVQTVGTSSLTLNELTLIDQLVTLPLTWGPVNAYRLNQTIKIEWTTYQEENADHFEIERSADMLTWEKVIGDVPATNTLFTHQYLQTDDQYSPSRLYYRIKLIDFNGDYHYSPIRSVSAENEINNLILYPNPSAGSFIIGHVDVSKIKTVQLFSNNGSLVTVWHGSQSEYSLQNISAGVYMVKITMTDGSSSQQLLQKQ